MDILQSIIGDKAGELVSGLVGQGFSQEQAENFLPEAGSSIVSAFKESGDNADADSILGNIDLSAIASKLGIDSNLVDQGMKFILPSILGQLGGSGVGGMLGKIKTLF